MATRITRRRLLTAGAALTASVAGGCSWRDPADPAARRPRQPPAVRRAVTARNAAIEADLELREAAMVSEQRLLELSEALLRRHPGLDAEIRPLVLAHRAHLRVLDELSRPDARAPVRVPQVPADRRSALTLLRRAERRAVHDRLADCVEARTGQLAQLLAAIAASGAQHVSLLAESP